MAAWVLGAPPKTLGFQVSLHGRVRIGLLRPWLHNGESYAWIDNSVLLTDGCQNE
jgi:hypothetical protein